MPIEKTNTQLVIEVAYARPDQQRCVTVTVPTGSTIRTAIERSRIQEQFEEIDLAKNAVGVWGQLRGLDDFVSQGDRVEIYRPLLVDPKQARRDKVNR